ncbi:MAG: putative Histidine kinase, partial [Candidatus Saccharibacteria bacterium]|nr:putative Histidine kinase [Candidatus Saccharibacteria bacterium]
MFDFYLVIDLIVVIALSALALTVLLQNSKARLNRTFALFVVSISIWIIANYVSNDTDLSPRVATVANYFVFFFSYAAAIYLTQFILSLSSDNKLQKIFSKIYWPLFTVALMGATPLVVTGVSLQDSVYAVHFGALSPLYFTSLIVVIVSAILIARRNIKKTTGDQHARLKILFRSMCWTFPILLLAQAVLPAATGWFGLTNIGILPMLILVYGLYYGVVKHRMFDLRSFVFRAAAYLLTTMTLSFLYVGPIVYFLDIFILETRFILSKFVLEVLLITVAATNYGRIKSWFDGLTSKIFFRDAYDSAALLGQLNRRLVATTNLSKVLEDSAEFIATSLKADFCIFTLHEGEDSLPRVFGGKEKKISASALKKAYQVMGQSQENILVTETISGVQQHLKDTLAGSDIAAIIRLSNNESSGNTLGYILLGYKKSGNPYDGQDVRTLESVADVLVIAIQNALHYEEIQRFNLTLQEKVSDATSQLRRTNAKLKTLDETKDDFISMASHQLRTPLTSVKGYLSMVLEGDAGKL